MGKLAAVRAEAAGPLPTRSACLMARPAAVPGGGTALLSARRDVPACGAPTVRNLVAIGPGLAASAARPVRLRSNAARIGLVASVVLHGAAAVAVALHGLAALPVAVGGPGAPIEVTLLSAGSALPVEATEAPAVVNVPLAASEGQVVPRPDASVPGPQAAPALVEAMADVGPSEPMPAVSPHSPEVGSAPVLPGMHAFEADKALALLADVTPARPEGSLVPAVARGEPEALPRLDGPPGPPPAAIRPRPREAQQAEPVRPVAAAAPDPTPAPARDGAASQPPSQTESRTAAQAGVAAGGADGGAAGLERQWAARVQSRIARAQRYPAGEGAEGTARVALTLGRDGRLHDVSLAGSSGHPALDRAAVEAVRRAGRFPAAPAGLTGESFRFAVRVAFRKG